MSDRELTADREGLVSRTPPAESATSMSPAKQALLLELLRKRAADGAHAIPKRAADAVIPATPGQRLLWVRAQMSPADSAYNVPVLRQIDGPVDVTVLGAAIDALVDRHEALRTTFVEHGDELTLDVRRSAGAVLETVHAADGNEAMAVARERAAAPLDLVSGPVFRATLITAGTERSLLLLVAHHALVDGASIGVLLRDLSESYAEAIAGGGSGRSIAPALQMGDVAVWTAREGAASIERGLAYWTGVLSGADGRTALPAPAIAQRVPGVGRVVRTLDAALTSALVEIARAEGATPFMALVALVSVLLARYGTEGDVVVGTPVANRDRVELRELVGFLANTLALRVPVAPSMSFRDVLATARRVCADALSHADVPFEAVASALRAQHPPTELSLDVMVVMQEGAGETVRLGNAALIPVPIATGAAKFDLLISGVSTPTGLRLTAEYAEPRLDEAGVARLLGHLEMLATAAIGMPDAPVATLALLTDAEREELKGWNATAVEYRGDATIPSLFRDAARRNASAVALESGDRRVTYGELDHASDVVAARIAAAGVARGEFVGVCIQRSAELVVALLGVLKSGAAYVPLDADYPSERLAFMASDAGFRVLLTDASTSDNLTVPGECEAILVEDVASMLRVGRPSIDAREPAADDVAYMIYTSGSTGRPKGALNSHRGIVNRLLWMRDHFALGTHTVLQKTPVSFDVSVAEIFAPLIAGSRLVIAEPGGHRDPSYLARTIADRGVTFVHFVPSMLRVFLEESASRSCVTLRDVVCSGEALPFELQEQFFSSFPGTRLHNLYGPTEAAVDVSCWECVRGDEHRSVPIGPPIANTQLHVLDERLQPVPIGVEGELYIGGVQVGRGYHGRPELTRERFIVDPFGADGARLYRTGDRARWRTDGVIEYLGRRDGQIKLRGFRIELGEIEAALAAHPAVSGAAIVVRGEGAAQQLAAYYVPRAGQDASPEELRDALARTLPSFMVPQSFVPLEALPLSPSGKLDRKALPEPPVDGVARSTRVPAASDAEHVVATIFAGTLGRDDVSVEATFFDLGGHSLLAARVVGQVNRIFRSSLTLRRFFEAPTVRELVRGLVADEAAPGQIDRIATALRSLQGMSAEERERLRQARAQSTQSETV